jgi:uncharacterized protein YlxW (UPF0749 family)
MPFWGGYGGSPLGLGWAFPLVGLLFMAVMAFLCFRVMAGAAGFGCRGGNRGGDRDDADDLRGEVRELREEVRRLREGVEGVTAWMQRE